MMNTSNTEGQCITRAPYFDGTNYSDWKERMTIFIQSVDFKLWLAIKNGPKIPTKLIAGGRVAKSEDEFDDEDMKNMKLEAKAKYILYCAMNLDSFQQVFQCQLTAKEMWDNLDWKMSPVNVINSLTSHPSTVSPADGDNSPDLSFLSETREAMEKFIDWCVPLHKYALEGNWGAAKRLLEKDERLKRAAIAAEGYPTVLHVAAGTNNIEFVRELLSVLVVSSTPSIDEVGLQDIKGNTAFCFAAAGGNMDIVNLLLDKKPDFATIRNANGLTPVQYAALQGKCEMASYLFRKTKHVLENHEWELLFFTCISNGNYHLALKMARMRPKLLAFARDDNNCTALHLLAQIQKPLLDSCHYCPKQEDLHHLLAQFQKPIEINPCSKQHVVFQLVKFLWTTILRNQHLKEEIRKIINKPSQLLFDATEVGNFGFLSELISAYPGLIWEVDRKHQSIIHKAVSNRHASIFNLVQEIGSQKDLIVTYILNDGNTLLHLAAKLAPQTQLQSVSGAAFQMCLELSWFEEVKKIMPTSYIKLKNCEGLTAQELFTKEHEGLRKNAEEWMKRTADSCMLISTVIATGVLAGAINIPGGVNDEKGGKPNYLGKTTFLVFAISDATAFISSATAIYTFLSILISSYAEYDFYKSLPLKLIIGLIMLFISITSMTVAFSSAFFITYYYESMRTPCFISAFAGLPILLFVGLQFPLLLDIIRSTIHYRGLFKSGEKKLMY